MRRLPPVCTENLIRIDCVTESPNVNGDESQFVRVEQVHVNEASLGMQRRRRRKTPLCLGRSSPVGEALRMAFRQDASPHFRWYRIYFVMLGGP